MVDALARPLSKKNERLTGGTVAAPNRKHTLMVSAADSVDNSRRLGRREGRRRRDAAAFLVLVCKERLCRRIQHTAIQIARQEGTVCSDEIREVVEVPKGSGSSVGPSILALVRTRVPERVPAAEIQTCRPSSHGRGIKLFRLRDETRADEWLRDNPLPADEITPPAIESPATSTSKPAPITDAAESLPTHQRSLFGGEVV